MIGGQLNANIDDLIHGISSDNDAITICATGLIGPGLRILVGITTYATFATVDIPLILKNGIGIYYSQCKATWFYHYR